MAYTAWSVVAFEQPTAAKWNQLGENDAGFKNATNIDDDAILSRHVNIIPTTDANGWRVTDLGTAKIYSKRITFSQTISGAVVVTLSSNNLPVGVSSISTRRLIYAYTTTGSAYNLLMVFEGNSSSTVLNFTAASNDGVATAYTGWIDVLLIDPT